jgi:hypothetical protein
MHTLLSIAFAVLCCASLQAQNTMPFPDGLVVDLDADKGLEFAPDRSVRAWQSQAPSAGTVFVSRDDGRKVAGSGQPTVRPQIQELNGSSALVFRQQELVCMDEDRFDFLTQGGGCTWVTVLAPHEQRVGLKDVNSFFGNLKNGGYFEGIWGCFTDDNRIWWGPRNGLSFGRFDANNPQLLGPQIVPGTFHIFAGRMSAGKEQASAELYVDTTDPIAKTTLPVNPKANPSKLAIGQERDAINHPGHESFDGEIARFLLFGRALDSEELATVFRSLKTRYQLR